MPGGRHCKLTPEVEVAICDALRAGATMRIAAEYAGVGERTVAAWLASRDTKFQQFQQAVKRATARGDVGALAVIQKAAQAGQWQAAAWLLERRHPAEYGRRQVVAVARAEAPDVEALQQAAARGVGTADAAVLFQRQLAVLESERIAGQISASQYLAAMATLNSQAIRLAEMSLRNDRPGQGAPHVQLSLKLDSAGIDLPAPLPDGVAPAAKAVAGGDLIDVG